jgi:hypothetical protein
MTTDTLALPARVMNFQDEAKECLSSPRPNRRAASLGSSWQMNSFEQLLSDDDIYISEELIARLHGAAENTILEMVAAFQADQRASLAMHC